MDRKQQRADCVRELLRWHPEWRGGIRFNRADYRGIFGVTVRAHRLTVYPFSELDTGLEVASGVLFELDPQYAREWCRLAGEVKGEGAVYPHTIALVMAKLHPHSS